MTATLTVTQRRSSNGCNRRQLDTLRSLGLRRIGHTIEIADSAQARGMVHAVRHIVEVTDASASAARKRASAASAPVSASEAPSGAHANSAPLKPSPSRQAKAADKPAAKAKQKPAPKKKAPAKAPDKDGSSA